MSQYNSDIDHTSTIAEYEGTPGSTIASSPSAQSPTTGGKLPTSTPGPMSTAGPVLIHLNQVSQQCEDTLQSLKGDMEMSSLAYARLKALHRPLQSQLDLSHLNDLVESITGFMISTTIVGYFNDISNDRLEQACDSKHLLKNLEAVVIKARLFARLEKRRVKHMRREMVDCLEKLHTNVSKMVSAVETHLGSRLSAWGELLMCIRYARETWEESA